MRPKVDLRQRAINFSSNIITNLYATDRVNDTTYGRNSTLYRRLTKDQSYGNSIRGIFTAKLTEIPKAIFTTGIRIRWCKLYEKWHIQGVKIVNAITMYGCSDLVQSSGILTRIIPQNSYFSWC